MKTVQQLSPTVKQGPDYVCPVCGRPLSVCCCGKRSIHVQHGEDRAVLGLSREGCRNADQCAGYDAMRNQMAAFDMAALDADALCEWAAHLQRRLEAAERRRAWAIALAGEHQTVVAAGVVFDVAVYNRVEVFA